MSFAFDSTLLAGRTVVVFEDLYVLNDAGREIRIASHADVNDSGQSVKIVSGKEVKPSKTPSKTPSVTPTKTPEAAGSPGGSTGAGNPRTGDTGRIWLYILLFGAAAAIGAGLLIIRKKTENK